MRSSWPTIATRKLSARSGLIVVMLRPSNCRTPPLSDSGCAGDGTMHAGRYRRVAGSVKNM
jgi:hypothetical protein